MMDDGYPVSDTGCWIPDTEYRIPDTGNRIPCPEYGIRNSTKRAILA